MRTIVTKKVMFAVEPELGEGKSEFTDSDEL